MAFDADQSTWPADRQRVFTTKRKSMAMQKSESTAEVLYTPTIDALDVSETWKETFLLIEKAGQTSLRKCDKLEDLSWYQRRKVLFNIAAFLVGPIYYLFKSMYRKGFILIGASSVYLSFVITAEATYFGSEYTGLGLATNAVTATFANYDYYRKRVHGEKMWPGASLLQSIPACLAILIGGLYVLYVGMRAVEG